jgi:PAS domain S-box-containing protein
MASLIQRTWRDNSRIAFLKPVLIAIACVAAATAVRLLLDDLVGRGSIPVAPLYLAVLVATLAGDAIAGGIAAVLSLVLIWWFITPPVLSFGVPSNAEILDVAVYAGTLALIVWVSHHYRQLQGKTEVLARDADAQAKRLALALDAGGMGTWEWDLKTNEVSWSPALEAIHGLGPGGFGGTFADFERNIHPDDRERVLAEIGSSLLERREHPIEYRILTPDGGVRWIEAHGNIARLERGKPAAMIGVCADITERKRAEEKLQLFARELEHRTRNILTTVKAIMRLTRADSVEGFVQTVNNRIDALARTHRLLSSNRWQGAELKRLIGDELSPYAVGPEKRVDILGPDLTLSVTGAESFGIVIHELTTNAVKYGALSRPDGRLTVQWSQPLRDQLQFDWIERGARLNTAPTRIGFGTRVIRTIVERELSGKVEFGWQSDGLHCHMALPSERLRREA